MKKNTLLFLVLFLSLACNNSKEIEKVVIEIIPSEVKPNHTETKIFSLDNKIIQKDNCLKEMLSFFENNNSKKCTYCCAFGDPDILKLFFYRKNNLVDSVSYPIDYIENFNSDPYNKDIEILKSTLELVNYLELKYSYTLRETFK